MFQFIKDTCKESVGNKFSAKRLQSYYMVLTAVLLALGHYVLTVLGTTKSLPSKPDDILKYLEADRWMIIILLGAAAIWVGAATFAQIMNAKNGIKVDEIKEPTIQQ